LLSLFELDYVGCGEVSINGVVTTEQGVITSIEWDWGVELHPKMIQIQQIFAYDDPLSVQISGEQPIACRKLDGSFFSATGGLFFGANQHLAQ
jgi:hypothetical protein